MHQLQALSWSVKKVLNNSWGANIFDVDVRVHERFLVQNDIFVVQFPHLRN